MADETGGGVRIGRLRWQVTFAQRQQLPVNQADIAETAVLPKVVHADIQSVNDMTWWGAVQTDAPVTHAIHMRFQDYPDNTYAIYRTTNLPDGSTRTETFRVRKVSELGGRKRFVRLLCQLETAA